MENFSKEDILKLRNFLQEIIRDPIPLDDQKKWILNGKMYCQEWEMIEILKCLFHGEETYLGDPPPNRLKNNALFDQSFVIQKSRALKETFKTAEAIISELRKLRGTFCGA